MMKINEIWNELESDNSLTSGMLLRRCSANVLPDLYVALRNPEKQKCIALKLCSIEKPELSSFSDLKDIKIELLGEGTKNNFFYLIVLLSNTEHLEVFSVFCEDLVSAISDILTEKEIVNEFLNRLEKWRSLFEKASLSGLSAEEQCGLYGELFFLRRWVDNSDNLQYNIKAWVGPEKQIRDFQMNSWALEVKATIGKNHQKVHISSERQLDTSNLNCLFLFHLSLETQQQNGESLNHLVYDLMKKFSKDTNALREFRTKLILAGYYKHQEYQYDATGYQVRNRSYYTVKDEFPRIEESEMRNGVGDVTYSIILSDCATYLSDEVVVFENIKNHE